MPGLDLDDLKGQLNWYSSSVSSAVRTTAFGVIAALWAIFSAEGLSLSESGLFGLPTDFSVRWVFVFASAALLTDILQYVSAYWMTNICVDKYELAKESKPDIAFYYNDQCLGKFGHILYRLSFYLFPTKLILAIASSLLFVILVFGVTWTPQ